MTSETTRRLMLLQGMYAIHESFCATFPLACAKGCRLCCTANVTLTSLEARLIAAHWSAEIPGAPIDALAAVSGQRFQPRLTINHIAELCVQGEDVPEEAADPAAGPCPLLKGDDCSIYAVRPFACRAMVSRGTCRQDGEADMPETILAANNMFMQYIEAMDHGGVFGNLTDLLLLFCRTDADAVEAALQTAVRQAQLTANRPIPALMIPPECRPALQPLMDEIRQLFQAAQ